MQPALPAPLLAPAVARVVERLDSAGAPPAPADLERLLAQFRQATADDTLRQFNLRQWKRVCWGIWQEPDPLAEKESFLDALLQRLWDGPSRSLCKTLIAVFLVKFSTAVASMRRVAEALAAVVTTWDWPWRERHERFALFDLERGPLTLGRACVEGDAPIAATLETAGINGVRRFGGMELAAFRESLDLLARRLDGQPDRAVDTLDRVVAWYEDALREGGTLAFGVLRPQLATALLTPWQQTTPDDALRQRITDFLLRHFKDPRIHPENWTQVPEDATAVLRRWLTRLALEQFFEVVDQVAEPGHWMYRRPFWMSYDKLNVIDDAWILFGPTAGRVARGVFDDAAGYGRIEDPTRSNHSIILMRIAGLTIAEVSHIGTCRIWKPGDPHAPKLYIKRYRLIDLVQVPDLEIKHHGSHNWTWQRKVADFIHRHTGIRSTEIDWRPAR
jgi:hypothetical protein